MTATDDAPVSALAARDRRDFSLIRQSFADLPGFRQDSHLEAFNAFAASCRAIVNNLPPLRRGVGPCAALTAIAHAALRESVRSSAQARFFFESFFQPFRIAPGAASAAQGAFFTGYYEPVVDGSLTPAPGFTAPVLARPDNLDRLAQCPGRAAIEAGALDGHTKPLVWLRDRVEVFLAQVQGSARVRLPDGRLMRLVYDGRNGHAYSSIGRILIETGEIAQSGMSLASLKAWIRDHGQNPGEAGFELMQRNTSYVFFSLREELEPSLGPIGGQGISLTPLRSIAVDRSIWSYGLPFWIAADLPWRGSSVSPLRRLMIAQDTGSAITGPARADIFFGSGDDAGARAGDIRHDGELFVLLPAREARDP
jgi:membrane-bound lytic murein transglycosylase A